MSDAIISAVWHDGAFHPRRGWHAQQCAERLGEGEVVALSIEQSRSEKNHNHQFAWIRDAWLNLPERYAMESWAQSPEHLRKFSLIKTGFCDTHTHVCDSVAEAQRWAAIVRPIDAYSVVQVQGSTVVRYVAKSQSRKAMGNDEFKRSKDAIRAYIADLIGVAPGELIRNAGQAA